MPLCPIKPYILGIMVKLGAVDPCEQVWQLPTRLHPEESDQWLTVSELLESSLFERLIGQMSWICLCNNLKNYRRQSLVARDGEGYRYDPYRFQVTEVGVERLLYFERSTHEEKQLRKEYRKAMMTERVGVV